MEDQQLLITNLSKAEAKTKILLFGRTGSGKSTVANMLISGNLNRTPLLFGTSSGFRGKTEFVQREEGGNMVVVDTMGFCEAEGGTVSAEDAKMRLYEFFVQTKDEYNYFAYVHKWAPTTYLDHNLWSFFKDAFKGMEENFIIIFTHCRPQYIEKSRTKIEEDFNGCQCYVSVDFPEIDPDEDPAGAMAKRDEFRRNESITLLKTKLLVDMPKPAVAPISITLSKGRLLLIGRHSSAIDSVARLLLNGAETASTPLVESPSTCRCVVDHLGRGWSVVTAVPFESYQDRISNMNGVDAAKLIASNILESVQNGSYSHFIYVEGGGSVSKVDNHIWKILIGLLADVEANVVALIVNTKFPLVNSDTTRTNTNLDQVSQAARKVRGRFQRCSFFMYLDLPALKGGDVPDVLTKKNKTREFSLTILENALCSSVTPRVEISIDKTSEAGLMSLLISYFVPVVELYKHPSIKWFKEHDPLSKLSRKYKELSTNTDGRVLFRQDHSCPDALEAKSTQLVVGSSNMSHIYLEKPITVAPLESIYVEVDSHDQGWSSYRHDQGTYRNSWTWGELSIMDHSRGFNEKQNVPRLRVYTNLHASIAWQCHKKNISCEDPEGKEFLKNIQNGDKVILWLRSMYPCWANYSRRGLIRITPTPTVLLVKPSKYQQADLRFQEGMHVRT